MSSPVFSDLCDVVLKDGSTVVFRPSTEAAMPPVRAFFESLSVESQYQRFFALARSDTFDEKAARRSRVAATASIRPFFEPRSVAVVGASRARGKIGSEIFHNLIASGFTGTLCAVRPSAAEIEGHPAYRSYLTYLGTWISLSSPFLQPTC